MKTKTCRKCSEEKSLDLFFKNKGTKDGRQVYCRTCQEAINKAYYEEHKERQDKYRAQWHRDQRKMVPGYYHPSERRKSLKKLGQSLEWYNETLQSQSGVCAICQEPETGKHQNGVVKSLAIDHNHATNQARGLLCAKCNHALHNLERCADWPERAVAYLNQFR